MSVESRGSAPAASLNFKLDESFSSVARSQQTLNRNVRQMKIALRRPLDYAHFSRICEPKYGKELPRLKPLIIRTVIVPALPIGEFRSFPSAIGTPCPLYPARTPLPLEHPQRMTTTVDSTPDPTEPSNDATLGTERLPAMQADR